MTRNTQGKLDTLKDDLFYLNGDILQTRNTTKVISLFIQVSKSLPKIYEIRFTRQKTTLNITRCQATDPKSEETNRNCGKV